MARSQIAFGVALVVAASSFVGNHLAHGHPLAEMFEPLHLSLFVGVLGSVAGAWLAKSPRG